MTKLEQLKAAYEAATPGEWKPCREHEGFDGPMFDLDADERSEYESRPFVRICAESDNVTTNHDLFEFRRTDANFIALAHNMMPQLLEAVEALKAVRARYEGEFDNPALMDRGALLTDPCEDMYQFAVSALENLK